MKTQTLLVAFVTLSLSASGCGGGGGTATPGSTPTPIPTPTPGAVSGIALPEEVSALPTSAVPSARVALAVRVPFASTELPAGSDYSQAATMKWVDERALSQFDILNTIMKAVAQTHYAEPGNVNAGPYQAVVGWEDSKEDASSKQLKTWTVDSSVVTENGAPVNVVKVWMEGMMKENPAATLFAELRISQAATRAEDGSYSDYGVWTLKVAMPDPSGALQGFFAATATREGGASVVMINQNEQKGPGPARSTKGILHKSATTGYGRVEYPDESCNQPPCVVHQATAAYVYDSEIVALTAGGSVVVKDRRHPVDMVNRYGLFDALTGADLRATHSFGFPIRVTVGGQEMWGNYGAWQGRHQIWVNGSSLDAGVTVTRADVDRRNAPTYTTSRAFTGTLVKRVLVDADLADLAGLVVETFVNKNFQLYFDGTTWTNCVGGNMVCTPSPSGGSCAFACGASSTPFTDWASLVVNPSDTRHMVNINAPPSTPTPNPQPTNLCYVAGSSPPAFTKATMSMNGPPTCTTEPYTIPATQQLWVNIGGPIYVQYRGLVDGWVQKTVASFDMGTYTATFDPSGDVPYTLEENREYYINNPGGNYVVRATSSGTTVKMELQSVSNPVEATALAGANPIFEQNWAGTGGSTYRFVTDPGDNFMKLVYETVGTMDRSQSPSPSTGALVTSGLWGLVLVTSPTGEQYNWDYPQSGCMGCGSQQYLLNADLSYHLLESPVRLATVSLETSTGTRNFSLQFDGNSVNGLPDIYRDLQQNDWTVTEEMAHKLVTIPSGTEVVDALDATKHYLFKELQVCEYLPVIPGGAYDVTALAAASALGLDAVPPLGNPSIGSKPTGTSLRYSEGKPVQ